MHTLFKVFLAALVLCTISCITLQSGVGVTGLSQCYGAPGTDQSPTPSVSPSASPTVLERSADVKSLITDMESATTNVKDYSLIGYIRLEKEMMVIDYRSVRPDKVRTEVLEGKLKGKAALYDPGHKKDSIKVKAGAIRIWQNIKKLKVDNTPLVESLLDTIIKAMNTVPEITVQGKVKCIAKIGNTLEVSMIVPGNPTSAPSVSPSATETEAPAPSPAVSISSPSAAETEVPTPSPAASTVSTSPSPFPSVTVSPSPSPSPEKAPQSQWFQSRTIEKECYLVVMKSAEGFVDTVAIDANDFWVFYIKRMKQESLVFEAIFTDLKVNTSPKMEL